MFKKVLVANRGEIAVRVIRACRECGVATVALYSEADAGCVHVVLADEAVCVGPPSPLESYLKIDAVIAAATETGCDAVHPGYGFLAENPVFAARVAEADLTFIGPRPKVIELLGNKVASRETMLAAGIPLIPGTSGKNMSDDELKAEAASIGTPLLIKAAAGGGGKGMRVVRDLKELDASLQAARREAASAFGDDTVFIERYLERPRHVEFQVLGDHDGNVIHLFERECSIQRRHQKIIEETPSPALDSELRDRMGEVAVNVARTAGYTNAGTVEFLLDDQGRFYFLEMNTRIQVEHPITEETTGVDLVREQLRVAAGYALPFAQDDLRQRGHAIECRLYAEDPARGFLPSPGKILLWREAGGPGVRVDAGVATGDEVSVYYDPILAKIITFGADREAARRRMLAALETSVVLGIRTNAAYLMALVDHPRFIEGATHTEFISDYMAEWSPDEDSCPEAILAAVALAAARPKTRSVNGGPLRAPSPWDLVDSSFQVTGADRLEEEK